MPMDEMKYGCLFVQSGYEERAIRYIERYLTDYEATGLEKIQYRSREGVRTQEKNRLMPGYVFFRTVTELEESKLRQVTGFVRLLCYESGCWTARMKRSRAMFLKRTGCSASQRPARLAMKFA